MKAKKHSELRVAVISAIFKYSDEFLYLKRDMEKLLVEKKISFWIVSSPDQTLFDELKGNPGIIFNIKADIGYADGWNNALDLLQKISGEVDLVSFLGEGDNIEELLLAKTHSYNNNTVLTGTTVRVSGKTQLSTVLPSRAFKQLFWLRIGGWTPSFLFPAWVFEKFRFDKNLKVGADLELFFYCRKLGLKFKKNYAYRVTMLDGGMSDNNPQGEMDYLTLSLRYHGTSLAYLGAFLRNTKPLLQKLLA